MAVERVRETTQFLEEYKNNANLSSQERVRLNEVLKELNKELVHARSKFVWIRSDVLASVLSILLLINKLDEQSKKDE